MPNDQDRTPQELQQLTTSIREMASRLSAEFVVDDRKAQNYMAAAERRKDQPQER